MKIEPVTAGYTFHENKVLLVFHKKLQMFLPIGGHNEDNETPDLTLEREGKEETGLELILLNTITVPMQGNITRQIPLPFYADIHKVGDHYHYCQNYICEIKGNRKIKLNYKELNGFKWFTEKELLEKEIEIHIKNISLLAFQKYRELK